MKIIEAEGINKFFGTGQNRVHVLKDMSFAIEEGDFVAIIGQSGSGKSTLMNILGCLDTQSSGVCRIGGVDIGTLDSDELAELRGKRIGFIFQRYNLLSTLSATENVALPAVYSGVDKKARLDRAKSLLADLGLPDKLENKPNELSGGQQQRVSIARALMNGGSIILADEPTGALDSKSGENVMDILTELNRRGHTIIVVTHDHHIAGFASRVIEIKDGSIISDTRSREFVPAPERELPRSPRASFLFRKDQFVEAFKMSVQAILAHKMRSVLTMLGIIIGVASVIAIVASIQGTTKLQRLQYEAMGANRIDVYAWGAKNKDWKDFEEYLDSLDEVAAWSPQSQYWDWQNGGVQYRSKKMDSNSSDNGYLQMYFVNEHYGEVTSMSISAGRDLTEADCKSRARVCVIGETLRKYFFGAMSPIGQELRIGGKSFEIVGVYAGKYGGKLNTNDQMLIMPYTLQSLMMSSQGMSDHQYIIKAENAEDIQTLTEQTLPEFMQPRCEVNGGYFSAYSNSQSQKQQEASSNLMALLGGGIASISLLVGGIGIMNIMLVSVTERTREIGIRMAIGARKRDIIGQFLVEAAVVSCCGGIIGIVLGCFASAVLGRFMLARQLQQNMYLPNVEQFTVLPSVGLVLGAFLFSALLGIIFGLYPANKASNLQPVDALRTQ